MVHTKGKSFEDLIDSNRPRLLRLCRIYAKTREDQEDLFQEIAYQIWRSMKNFRGEAQIETFLYRIALNTALLFQARQKRRPPSVEIAQSDPAFEMNLHEKLDKADKISWLHEAIKTLKPIEQSLIFLYLEEMSYEEISHVTGLKANHVGVKLNRIKKKLSQKIKTN